MHALILVSLAFLAHASASAIGGPIIAGPSGVVTGLGPIGPNGAGILGGGILGAPISSGALLAGPALGLGVAPLGLTSGIITNGGGAIGVSGLGASVVGPPTAPVVIAGPSGKIAADGLWGPTLLGGKGW